MNNYHGIPIIESPYMTKVVQDWSGCRSKARAMRRHARGIKTRMVERVVPISIMFKNPLCLVIHPSLKEGLLAHVETA